MRISFILLFTILVQAAANGLAQKVHLNQTKLTYEQLFDKIEAQTGIATLLSNRELDLQEQIVIEGQDFELKELLDVVTGNTELTYELVDNYLIIRPLTAQEKTNIKNAQQPEEKKITVKGSVVDSKGEALVGVNVIVKETRRGSISDVDGNYIVTVDSDATLLFSFIGMKDQEVSVQGRTVIDVIMQDDVEALSDVVVTGYYERDKSTFTGAAETFSGAELRTISTSNVIQSIGILDPSVVVMDNNIMGSNPNHIPEIIIRGTTSLNASNEAGINSPLIVLDGVETTINALYDMDIFEIELVTILKDVSATALYGEQASNGVILITRKKTSQKEVRASYNFSGTADFADLSQYSLMNASQKLELERLAGLYDSPNGALDIEYNEKLAKVNSGIDTDWIAKPLRNAFSQMHTFNVTGRGSGMSYGINGRYGHTNGVMKDDFRKNMSLGFYFSYNHKQKLIATFRADYDQLNTQASKYGSFNDYTRANPYDAPYDEDGELVKELSYGLNNPLYEASLSSFGKSKTKVLTTSLNLRWNIKPGFYITSNGYVSSNDVRADSFLSPNSNTFIAVTDPAKKGSYSLNATDDYNFYLKAALNYNKNLDGEGSMLSFNLGGETRKNNTDPYGFIAQGFFNDMSTDMSFATQFPEGAKPSGQPLESSSIGIFSAVNLTYRNRYFMEGSYRISGSSKFGTNKRYAPFWSIGAGWNLHKESFLDFEWIDILRLRGSYGHTGSINFSPYQAITTYRYSSELSSMYGYGASPITMGNEDLTWETTKSTNLGLTSTFLNNRLNLNVDVYKKVTIDMIVPISMPPSTGVDVVNNNVGEQENEGFEVALSYMLINKKDINWRLGANASRNKTTLIDIGNTLRKQNEVNASNMISTSPLTMFVEGESPTMLYAVPSAGIDPATGREIFIKKDGSYTYQYDPKDKVAINDRNPKLRGALSSYLTYKKFTLGINMTYSLGGYIYNSTRASKIEQINPMFNADSRAFTDRWKEPGDVVDYITIVANEDGIVNNYHSSRFVEKENYLNASSISLNYEFDRAFANKIGFRRLSAGMFINNAFQLSTVAQERGLRYPFARGFGFTLSSTF
ncbi:TonB-linked outer membrane protein, SusC/RagA family [Saccharicrinis carchari]|uniref:TonB-linked outer membrane protein, SusC/RagA family n=2 Tax=Saccharicrinis carchari TaxID=1168039 RepID=A0A521C6J5_SACCC|nr:TonB-linked outer membrane protein, SusC/RagA family [Saccharicrinis carchari]